MRKALFLVTTVLIVLGLSGMSRHHEGHEAMMMGRTSAAPTGADDAPGAVAFQRFCSRCHATPDPQRHTAQEWPAVIARMQKHMISRGIPPPPEEILSDITDYLQRNARL